MPPSPRTSARWLLVPLVVGLTALTSCGDQAHTSVPTSQAGGAIGRAAGDANQRRTGMTTHLLAADKMPTAGAKRVGTDTARDDFEVLGPCHLASLVDIGALSAVRRTFRADASVPRAVQVVARFADNKSAWRAHEVLDSWQADCAGRLEGEVGPLREVDVPTGVAQAYRVAQSDRATDLGIVRKGSYLSVVALVAASPDALPQDSSAARAALKRIAATF